MFNRQDSIIYSFSKQSSGCPLFLQWAFFVLQVQALFEITNAFIKESLKNFRLYLNLLHIPNFLRSAIARGDKIVMRGEDASHSTEDTFHSTKALHHVPKQIIIFI